MFDFHVQDSGQYSINTEDTLSLQLKLPLKQLRKSYTGSGIVKQEVSLKTIIVEGYRTVGSLNDSLQSSNFLLTLFVAVVLY